MVTVELKMMNIKEGDLVLDAGCGEGRHTWELIKNYRCKVLAMDLDFEGLLKNYYVLSGLEEKEESRGKYFVLLGDVLTLPFPDEAFDVIICSEVLEHVDDEYKAMEELVRVLKPGGIMGVSVPTWITESVCWRLDKNYSHPGGHIRIFRAKQIRALLEKNGLQIFDIERRHSLHSFYWFLRSLFKVDREKALFPRLYLRSLTWTEKKFPSFSNAVENLLNPLLGKSLVLYSRKYS